jgi:hypothetical protein
MAVLISSVTMLQASSYLASNTSYDIVEFLKMSSKKFYNVSMYSGNVATNKSVVDVYYENSVLSSWRGAVIHAWIVETSLEV